MNSNRGFIFHILFCLSCLILAAGCQDESNSAKSKSAKQSHPVVGTLKTTHASSSASSEKKPTKPTGTLPMFRTIGAASGLDFKRYDDIGRYHRILEVNGGGVGLFDFDLDGLLDIFLTNGCRLPLKPNDRDSPGALFRNLGNMHYERINSESYLVQFGFAHGCAVGDYDADGFDDLYITAFGDNALWRNNGDGTFTDVTGETGTNVPEWSSSAAFADVNRDGRLDLYVVNYLVESDQSPKLCPNSLSPDGYTSCTPAAFDGVDDVLFLSDGEGGFIDVTAASGMAELYGKGLGVVISDLDGDLRPEIYVANDGQANFLFVPVTEAPGDSSRLDRVTMKFNERALSNGVALNESGYAQASMGIAAGDYDNNETVDLFLTHFYGDTNTLYTNRGGLRFEDSTRNSKLGASSRRTLGFGTAFLDVDNDGWLDLFVANGHVDDRTWTSTGVPYQMRPQMYRNEGDGSFVDVSHWSGEYFLKEWLGRGVALGDLDRDGKLYAVISHQLAPSIALGNETRTDNVSLVIRLIGTSSNRNGYGARVELVDEELTVVRELFGGGSFQSASAPEIHLGIGTNRHATIRIHWPSGKVETHSDLPAGFWIAIEGQDMTTLPMQE